MGGVWEEEEVLGLRVPGEGDVVALSVAGESAMLATSRASKGPEILYPKP